MVVVELGFRDYDTVQLGAYDADGALPLGLDTHQHTGDFFSFHVVPLGGTCPSCGRTYRRAGSGGAVGLLVDDFEEWGSMKGEGDFSSGKRSLPPSYHFIVIILV